MSAAALALFLGAPPAAAHYQTAFDLNGDQYCGDQDTSDFNSHVYPVIAEGVEAVRGRGEPYDLVNATLFLVDEIWPDGLLGPLLAAPRAGAADRKADVESFLYAFFFGGFESRLMRNVAEGAGTLTMERSRGADPNSLPFQDYTPRAPRAERFVWNSTLHVHHDVCLRDYYNAEPAFWLKSLIRNL